MAFAPKSDGARRRIGVAMCTFNGEAYLDTQWDSVVRQDPAPDFVVVSDDGSTDDTAELLQSLATNAPFPVEILAGPRAGVAANFAHALAHADADVVFLADQDDRWREGKVSAVLAAWPTSEVAMVFTDAHLVDRRGLPTGGGLFDSLRLSESERSVRGRGSLSVLVRRNIVTGATAAVSRPLIERALPVPVGWLHDEWLAVVAAVAGELVAVRDKTIDYRQHGANVVGVGAPTLAARWRRMWASESDRFERQRARWTAAREILAALPIADEDLALIDGKVRFEERRCDLPRARWRRPLPVLRLVRSGAYARFASQGSLDAVRDVLVR